MLQAYRDHVAERAALGIPPLPLSAKQTAEHAANLTAIYAAVSSAYCATDVAAISAAILSTKHATVNSAF